jgi:hypothetical protein
MNKNELDNLHRLAASLTRLWWSLVAISHCMVIVSVHVGANVAVKNGAVAF